MESLAALIIGVEMAQEPQELRRPVLGVTLAGHLALGHFQRREQRGGAVAHVVVRPRAGPPALERQPGWRETVCGMPHFARHTLRGDFPFAWIDFANDHWPGRAGL